ncbi:PAN domain-containing protein [Sinobacterium caligoides]|uniref:PAN domain-containing protein n=1 Tax=Sinobacterium caligoides TaxID=933926 RepID=A0A3N2DQJ3_9GAMM|nr:PAN domain-containing protein [Sinobacterium caligoides]ROS02070.1 PAN domain-containing protein [Sinobacterium caligoides]
MNKNVFNALAVALVLPATALAAAVDNFTLTADAAIAGYNNERLTSVSVDDCANACLDGLRSTWCVSFDYHKDSQQCDLSDKRAADVGGLKRDYSDNPYDHYSLDSEALKKFQRSENSAISGFNMEHLNDVTEGDCADQCDDDSRPWCVSFDYYKDTQECDLSSQRADDVGGLVSSSRYDHYSRRLNSLEHFAQTEDAAIAGFNVEQLIDVSPDECAEACLALTRAYWCQSFDYNKNDGVCDLSDQTAESVGGLKRDYPGSPYDHYARVTPRPVESPIPGNKHILLIGFDGLRGDSIQCDNCADTPNFDALIAGGAFHDNVVAGGKQSTYSGPGWSSVFTGYWADQHGVTSNSTNLTLQKPHVFDLIKQSYPTATVGVAADWLNLTTNLRPKQADYVVKTATKKSQQTTDEVIQWLSWQHAPTAIFYYLHNTDIHTSSYDPENSTYQTAIESEDAQMGQVLTALKNRPNYANEDWLIVVTSDHGGLGKGHGGQSAEERNTFIVLNNRYGKTADASYCQGDLSDQPLQQVDGAAAHILDFLAIDAPIEGHKHPACGN